VESVDNGVLGVWCNVIQGRKDFPQNPLIKLGESLTPLRSYALG